MEQKECKPIFESPDPRVDPVPDLVEPFKQWEPFAFSLQFSQNVLVQAQAVFVLCASTAHSSAFFTSVVFSVLVFHFNYNSTSCVTFLTMLTF
jgi:hypothetical protein